VATIVKCPTCQRDVAWTDIHPFRPFCSERCRLVDLGAWLTEQRGLPGADGELASQPEDGDDATPL